MNSLELPYLLGFYLISIIYQQDEGSLTIPEVRVTSQLNIGYGPAECQSFDL